MRPCKFLAAIQAPVDARRLSEQARRVESIGYDGLVITDHLGIDLVDKMRALRERFGISSLMVGEPDDRVTPLVERLAGT